MGYSHIAMTDCDHFGSVPSSNSKVFANDLVCADSRERWTGRPTFGSASRALAEVGSVAIQRFGSVLTYPWHSMGYSQITPPYAVGPKQLQKSHMKLGPVFFIRHTEKSKLSCLQTMGQQAFTKGFHKTNLIRRARFLCLCPLGAATDTKQDDHAQCSLIPKRTIK